MPGPPHQETQQPIIGLYPSTHAANAYIARNRELLAQLGTVVEVPRARVLLQRMLLRILSFKSSKCFDVLIINWTENMLLSRGAAPTLRGSIAYFFLLRLFRRAARKLIYVRHNDYPHGLSGEHRVRTNKRIAKGQRLADAVVAHSPVYAAEHGYHYVPHPLYRVTPGATAGASNEYLIFGRIMPYKNIDQLIKAWPSNRQLAIIGPGFDDAYLAELQSLAEGKPIRFDIGFHDEADLVDQLAASRGVIIANDPGSLVVSGTFFFAMSVGARVLTPGSAFYGWVKTTALEDSVLTFDSIPALARHVEAEDASEAPQPEVVRAEARKLFGDDAVVQAWRALIC